MTVLTEKNSWLLYLLFALLCLPSVAFAQSELLPETPLEESGVPFLNNITLKLEHFYANENPLVTAPDNFFYSHSYWLYYGCPAFDPPSSQELIDTVGEESCIEICALEIDTDGDGYGDCEELQIGSDPFDANDPAFFTE